MDAMLTMVKGNLMKCDINDISINRNGNTYSINFKHREGGCLN